MKSEKDIVVDIPQRDFDWRPKQLRDRSGEAPDTQHEHAKEHGLEWKTTHSEDWTANLPERYIKCQDCHEDEEESENAEEDAENSLH